MTTAKYKLDSTDLAYTTGKTKIITPGNINERSFNKPFPDRSVCAEGLDPK